MFKKWNAEVDTVRHDNGDKSNDQEKGAIADGKKEVKGATLREGAASMSRQMNTILKGSKVTGDINVTCDLEITGDVEGNITSYNKSNIVIRGICKGNIETKEGNIDIDGSLRDGNIIAGGDVSIGGKFNGGSLKAKGKVYINGEFAGTLEANEIEIGSNAQGTGELHYREYISISRGAKVEARISQIHQELKVVKETTQKKVVDIKPGNKEPDNKELKEAK